jgi:hypothetical protein
MKLKDFFDNPEEIFIGAALQFPLYFIVGWWVIPIMIVCGFLWRWGGCTGGWKPARWALVPLLVCLSAFLCGTKWPIFLAAPFMVKLMPFSYGKSGWLWKWLKNDFLVRMITFAWYWLIFSLASIYG